MQKLAKCKKLPRRSLRCRSWRGKDPIIWRPRRGSNPLHYEISIHKTRSYFQKARLISRAFEICYTNPSYLLAYIAAPPRHATSGFGHSPPGLQLWFLSQIKIYVHLWSSEVHGVAPRTIAPMAVGLNPPTMGAGSLE